MSNMQQLPHNHKTQINEIFEHFGVDNDTPVESFGSTKLIIVYNDGTMLRHESMHLKKAITWADLGGIKWKD